MPRFPAIDSSTGVPQRTIATVLSLANPDVLVIAHRGIWIEAPENSLSAIRAAVTLGLDMVEIDVRISRDGVPVVIHDDTLDRTTDGTGPVGGLDRVALHDLRLRAGAGGEDAPVTDERMPTLAEALEEARGRILVNIETKRTHDLPQVVAVALDLGVADGVLVKAVVEPESVVALSPEHVAFGPLPFMPLLDAREGRFAADIARLAPLHPAMVECHAEAFEALSQGRAALREAGMRLWVNSLDCAHIAGFDDSAARRDPHAVWGALVDAGVGAIQTDLAEELVAFLVAIGRRRA